MEGLYLLEDNFNFELENINLTTNDIGLLKRYANDEITFNELVDIVKNSNL